MPTIILGRDIANNPVIPEWLNQPHHRLTCTTRDLPNYGMIDFCCLCSRKRKVLEFPPEQPTVKSVKKLNSPTPFIFTSEPLTSSIAYDSEPEKSMQID
ncbi:hypothetical protein [Spongorhabdus nitratireducens]